MAFTLPRAGGLAYLFDSHCGAPTLDFVNKGEEGLLTVRHCFRLQGLMILGTWCVVSLLLLVLLLVATTAAKRRRARHAATAATEAAAAHTPGGSPLDSPSGSSSGLPSGAPGSTPMSTPGSAASRTPSWTPSRTPSGAGDESIKQRIEADATRLAEGKLVLPLWLAAIPAAIGIVLAVLAPWVRERRFHADVMDFENSGMSFPQWKEQRISMANANRAASATTTAGMAMAGALFASV